MNNERSTQFERKSAQKTGLEALEVSMKTQLNPIITGK